MNAQLVSGHDIDAMPMRRVSDRHYRRVGYKLVGVATGAVLVAMSMTLNPTTAHTSAPMTKRELVVEPGYMGYVYAVVDAPDDQMRSLVIVFGPSTKKVLHATSKPQAYRFLMFAGDHPPITVTLDPGAQLSLTTEPPRNIPIADIGAGWETRQDR